MIRNRFIFPISLLVAIAIHAIVLIIAEGYYLDYRGSLDRQIDRLRAASYQDHPILISLDPPPELDLGKEDGVGDAVNELDQPDEMTARQADQIQAPLTRDPSIGADADTPPQPLQPPPLPPAPPADQPPAPPPPPPLSREITQPDAPGRALPAQPGETVDAAPLLPLASLLAEAAHHANPPTPDPSEPQPRAAPDDPLPQAEADSDPFHTHGSVTFRAGKVDAQFGRAVKPVRPHIRLAGRWDGLALQHPSVTLRIRTDEQGNVRAAEVTESSGSLNIDQPVLVAIYDWWFEPPRDRDGNPRPDVFTFTLHFR